MKRLYSAFAVVAVFATGTAEAQVYPTPKENDWVTHDFRFHTGEVIPELRIQPSEMSSRNWMMRRLIIDTIRSDPEWNNGNYTAQPRSTQVASVFYSIATAGGTLAYQKLAPTREAADKLLNERLGAPFPLDANDVLYMSDASRDYNPSPELERTRAVVLAI